MCTSCGPNNHPTDRCFEARLSLGTKQDKSAIVGSLDRVSITPIPLKPIVEANETITSLRYDTDKRAIVYSGEAARRQGGSSDFVYSREVLAGANISELGGVGRLVNGGIPTVSVVGNELQLQFTVPEPIQSGEVASGFLTYVANPNANSSHLKSIRPDTNGTSDSILLGRADGSIEFSAPMQSPILIPTARLKDAGSFVGAPAVASGTWRYQQMGTSDVITNTSGSTVRAVLSIRYSMVSSSPRGGMYCRLTNGGADYKTTFIEGVTDVRHEGLTGGRAEFTVVLAPNEKCQFDFGSWNTTAGNIEMLLGGLHESAGAQVKTVYRPVINIIRSI